MEPTKRKERSSRQRARRACEFCSRRKIKCPGEEPSCSNCTAYGEDCVYKTGPKKPRPSNSRILHLEEENRRLQKRLEQSKSQSLHAGKRSIRADFTGRDTDSAESSDSANEHSSSSAEYRAENSHHNSFEYHGPSSVLFEVGTGGNKPSDRQCGENGSAIHKVAETAQRRLENFDLTSVDPDLDGIDPDLAAELLRLYWTRTNSFFMLVYEPAFNKSRSTGGPYFSRLLLNAMYFSASRYLQTRSTHDGQTLEDHFRLRFKHLLTAAYDRSSITTMQGLLIVSISLSAVGKHRRLAWLYSGMAFRMLIDLGLHTNNPDERHVRSDEDTEINHRVFWGAFVIDKLQAFYHGRPVSIQEADTMVPLDFQDLESKELEHWYPTRSAPPDQGAFAPYSVSNFLQVCRLAIIMNKILNKIYREKRKVHGPEAIKRSVAELNSELNTWQFELPQHLQISLENVRNQSPPPAPQVYVILLMSQVIRILLHRPFVSYGHLQSVLPEVAKDSFAICATAANNIGHYLESYNSVHSFTLAPYFLFYASYVSATIHVRIAAQRHLDTNAAMHCLQTCMLVFDVNFETNPAVKKAKAVIEGLMRRMDVNLTDCSTTQEARTVNWRFLTPQTVPRIFTSERQDFGAVSNGGDVLTLEPSQGFAMSDLDFDAILQSFSQPEQGRTRTSQIGDGSWSQAHGATLAPFMSSHVPGLESYQNAGIPNTSYLSADGHMEDTLFGFDTMAGPEDGW